MPTLRAALNDLASSFTESVLAAIRSASVDELLAQTKSGTAVPNGRRGRAPTANAVKPKAPGRLPRRSADAIEAALGQVVGLVKKHKEGLRAEQIREGLGLQSKELPRILKQGLSTKKLKAKGQKRATTYFA